MALLQPAVIVLPVAGLLLSIPSTTVAADSRSTASRQSALTPLTMSSQRDIQDHPEGPAGKTVAVLVSRFPAITETFILREITEMERQGQPVRLVPMLHDAPPVVHPAARAWTERALFTPFVSLSIIVANLATLVRQPWRYVTLLVRLIGGTMMSPDMLIRTLALFPKSVFIARQLEREGIRHIHAHFATHPTTMALIIASFSSLTFSFTVHAHDIFVDRRLLRWKLRETRFVRSISDYNRRFLERLYPSESAGKIDVIHVGIDPGTYERAGREVSPAGPPPRLLSVAAHKPYKGLPTLIEACRILRDEGLEFRCDVVGRGPMTAELQRMIDERDLGEIVELAGAKTEDEVTRLMAEATLFVLPSTIAADGQMEGIPVALMEALATGRPVVTTSTSGIPELVKDGVNGRVVEHDSPAQFAAAIGDLLRDRDALGSMGLRGQETVRSEFALSPCVAALIARLEQEAR